MLQFKIAWELSYARRCRFSVVDDICGNAGEPGIGMLVNSVHNVQMGRALAELVLTREAGEITWH